LPVCSPATGLAVTASTLSGAPQLIIPKLDRSLVTAFPSPATAPAFADSIPGSKVPACYFAVLPAGLHARSAIRLRCRNWFAPIPAASTLQARCISARKLIRPLSPSPLPSGSFRSLGIKAFNGRCCRPVRLPNSPDLRSLPTAGSISRLSCGSSSAVRYVSGGLLFLKPLGTTITMLLEPYCRQSVYDDNRTLFNRILLLCFESVTAIPE
jgi:hypothetical protein